MSSESTRHFSLPAAVLAWLWPGLGHMRRGEHARGWRIMAGVLFLFLSGVLVGGVSCVDRREQRLWFYAQVFCGPIALAADYANQHYVKTLPPDRQLTVRSLAHVREMGTLFAALAGLMNLVVMLDAMHPAPRHMPDRRRAIGAGERAAAGSLS